MYANFHKIISDKIRFATINKIKKIGKHCIENSLQFIENGLVSTFLRINVVIGKSDKFSVYYQIKWL